MRVLRLRLNVLLFLGLISLGQAYPFSYVWAAGQHSECGCNQSGRKCIHGCELKKKKAASRSLHSTRSGHGKIQGCHSEPAASWVSPTCSKQRVLKLVSFQSDPFVLPSFQFCVSRAFVNSYFPIPNHFLEFIPALDPPPPRAI